MECNNINYDSSHSLKQFHHTLRQRISSLEKQNANSCPTVLHNVTSSLPSQPECEWPSLVPRTLKDKIADNFRSKISQQNLRSFICSSCSTSGLARESVTVTKSELNLSCLQHPEMRLSGNLPDVTHSLNENLDVASLAEGLLLDRRGINNVTLSFCKECMSYI
jgi:hypothetical protein